MSDSELRLVDPTERLRDEFVAFVTELHDETPSGFHVEPLEDLVDFGAYVERLRDQAHGVGLPAGFVASNSYWLVHDTRVVARSRLRHELNASLRLEGGHIGYAVRPSDRRQGYGTRVLALTLEKARERGLERVMVTCDEDNIASARIIQTNGGVFEGDGPSPRTGKTVQRYWIEL